MAVMAKLFVGDTRGFAKLNKANIILIPKRVEAEEIGDFRPISLIHSIPKLFAKVLANRLRSQMHELVGMNQSAFIKGRELHDNFLLVRQVARKIHARRTPGVFIKLDISHVFDSLSWPFLFEVMRAKGFGQRWLDWMAALLHMASTKVVVNGSPGRKILHACGLRQGDPISPLLFVIAMEALSALVHKAADMGVLASFAGITTTQKLSIYADDVAMFARLTEFDLDAITEILKAFGEASGLRVNYRKSTAVLIRGSEEDKARVAGMLQCDISEFPCRYLGLKLAIKSLTKAEWQPMLDKVRHSKPAWQRGVIQRPGRLILVQSVVAARPVHHLMVTEAPEWVLEDMNKWMRAFF